MALAEFSTMKGVISKVGEGRGGLAEAAALLSARAISVPPPRAVPRAQYFGSPAGKKATQTLGEIVEAGVAEIKQAVAAVASPVKPSPGARAAVAGAGARVAAVQQQQGGGAHAAAASLARRPRPKLLGLRTARRRRALTAALLPPPAAAVARATRSSLSSPSHAMSMPSQAFRPHQMIARMKSGNP